MNLPRFGNHPMAGDEVGHRIDGNGVGNGSKGFRMTDIRSDILITDNTTFGYA